MNLYQINEEIENCIDAETGEILDVDGICGGYNLQWAWTSGYLAGKGAANA